jgi:hypothetical protein
MFRHVNAWGSIGLAVFAASPVLAVFDYDLTFDDTHEVVSLESLEEGHFKHTFTNTGTESDTYEMVISSVEYHTGDENSLVWTLCNSVACVLPGFTEEITLGPSESDTVTVKIVPIFTDGSAKATLTFRSQGSGEEVSFTYGMVVTGTDVVIIDDDGGDNFQSFVASALASGSASYGIYDTTLQPLSEAPFNLHETNMLVYLSGNQSASTITLGDATYLASYLNQGGRLIASGQGLFNDISGGAFATTYLNASRVSTQTGQFNVQALPGSPLQSDDAFVINQGAMNQTTQDELTGAIRCFRYANGKTAGVCRDNGTYKTVSLGFGLEAVGQGSGDITLSGLLSLIRGWFDSLLELPDLTLGPAPNAIASAAAPNPLRSAGRLRLVLGDAVSEAVRVTLYSVSGRRVATLFEGRLPAGVSEIAIDPRQAAGGSLSAGVYRYRVEAGDAHSEGSLTLLD